MTGGSAKLDAILLLGPTGAGKSPLGDHIEKKGLAGRRCLHFDFGAQLRSVAESNAPPEGFTGKEHAFIKDVLEKGLLLENEHFHIAEKIVGRFVGRGNLKEEMLILNGLPRHADQARDLGRIVNMKGVVVLECSAEDVHARIRRNTGGDRTGRIDDDLQMVIRKLEIFHSRTASLVDYYAGAGCGVYRIKVTAESTPEHVYSALSSSVPVLPDKT